MKKFSFYQVYLGQTPQQQKRVYSLSNLKGYFPIGIDTHFYPPCTYENGRVFRAQLKFMFDYFISYIKWYIAHLRNKRLVIPVSLFATVVDWLMPGYQQSLIATETMSDFYLATRSTDYINELMATYIRYVSSPSERFGCRPYVPWILNRFICRAKAYEVFLNFIYLLFKPSLYVTGQRCYLQSYIPCSIAIKNSIPVAYLGSTDASPLQISSKHLKRDWYYPEYSFPVNIDTKWKLSRDAERFRVSKQLYERISGSDLIDPLMPYMKSNPYNPIRLSSTVINILGQANIEVVDPLPSWKSTGFVVVFMHEFNDYHHNGILPSFASSYYHWLTLTLSILFREQIPFLLKIHPSILSSPDNEKYHRSLIELTQLSSEFSEPLNVSKPISTSCLIDHGMKLGVTVRGTVATELVYMRCPVVCAGKPPYMNFLPNRVTDCLFDYKERLCSYQNLPVVSHEEYHANLDYLSGFGRQPFLSADEHKIASEFGLL